MECAPDWFTTLRRASFRGVPFFIEHDQIEYGRRIHTHQYPNRDRPFQEDLGEQAVKFEVTAYVASNNVLSEAKSLVSACRQRGPGTLVLPTEGGQQVVCFKCTRAFAKDKLGYMAFSLSFGEAGADVGLITSALLDRLVGLAAEQGIGSLVDQFLAVFNTAGEATWVVDAALGTMRSWLAVTDDARLGLPMTAAGGLSATTAIQAAYDNAASLVRDGRGLLAAGSRLSVDADAYRSSGVSSEPTGALVIEVGNIMAELRLGAVSSLDAVETLLGIATTELPDARLAFGPSALAEQANAQAISSAFRQTALIEMAVAAAATDFTDRQTAMRVRAQIAEAFEQEMLIANGAAFRVLDEIRGKAIHAISAKAANLQPLITVEASAPLPSLVWAYRLYADATRAGELEQLNRVPNPLFMPTVFEAKVS